MDISYYEFYVKRDEKMPDNLCEIQATFFVQTSLTSRLLFGNSVQCVCYVTDESVHGSWYPGHYNLHMTFIYKRVSFWKYKVWSETLAQL